MLTNRQREILQCLFDYDQDYDKVAEKLVITRGSAKMHMKNIYRRLFVNNAVGAFRIGLVLGWINVEESVISNPPLLLQDI